MAVPHHPQVMPPEKRQLLRMAVPRKNLKGPLAFEQFLSHLHGQGFWADGRNDGDEAVSFEIVGHGGRTYFYLSTEEHTTRSITGQLYAQYPSVVMEEKGEYFTRRLVHGRQVYCAELGLKNLCLMPLKTHKDFVDTTQGVFEDPLGGITAALTQLHDVGDTAVIQCIISPTPEEWNDNADKYFEDFFREGYWQYAWWRRLTERVHLDPHLHSTWYDRWLWKGYKGLMGLLSMLQRKDENAPDENEQAIRRVSGQSTDSGEYAKESIYKKTYEKISQKHFAVTLRVAYITADTDQRRARTKLSEIVGTFQQFGQPGLNRLDVKTIGEGAESPVFGRMVRREEYNSFPLSQIELSTIIHLPTESVTTAGIQWVESRQLEPPPYLPNPDTEKDVTLIASTYFRGVAQNYGIKQVDRRRHCYIIGKTGMGKSGQMETMAYSDLMAGHGIGIIDPHGDFVEHMLQIIPKHRTNDVILFDPSDRDFPLAFNLLEGKNVEQRSLIASGVVSAMKKLFADSWGPRLEYFLRNIVLSLVEAPDTTMLGINRMLVDKHYRNKILKYVTNPMVLQFWHEEFAKMQPRQISEAAGPIQNKVGQFLSTPTIRNILGQPKSAFDLRFAMDSGKIVLVNLSKGKIGEDNAALLGSLLITKFQLDAMSRADIEEEDRRDFYLYVDEFQNFATDSFAVILSEARKYRIALTMANQYIAQMSDEVREAVFGNVGSIICYQVGIKDAEVFAQQFDEERIDPVEIASLPKYTMYNRIMVDGITTPVFSGRPPNPPRPESREEALERVEKIKKFSRQRYTKPRDQVEEKILRWSRSENEKGHHDDDDAAPPREKKPAPPAAAPPASQASPKASASPQSTPKPQPAPPHRPSPPAKTSENTPPPADYFPHPADFYSKKKS